ncbi:MAG: serine hydrolase [Pseudomonadota bacterium]
MMRQSIPRPFLFFCAAGVLSMCVTSARAIELERFEQDIERGMVAWQIPGVAVAVVEDGKSTFAKGFGSAGLEDAPDVTTDTFFINASTTKAMVATGMLLLVEEGKVDLDDAAIDYLPEVHFADPALTPQITIRDLLTHRTGLPSTDFWTFNQGMALADQLPRLRHVEPVAAPRERKIYQNTMYELAGLVIERVSGEAWEDFLTRRLWRPIGMRTVGTRNDLPQGAPRAQPYDVFDGEVRKVNHSLRGEVSDAAGSAWSSVEDMVLWIEFLLRGGVTERGQRLLSAAALEEMFTPQQLVNKRDYYPTAALTRPNWISYGLGWYQQDFQGHKIDYHTGSLNGATAIVGLDREAGRGMVMLANRGGAELRHALLWSVMDEGDTAPPRDWVGEVTDLYRKRSQERARKREELEAGRLDVPPSLPLEAYAGSYNSARGGPLAVLHQGDALQLNTQVRTYRLTPWHSEIFLLMHEDWANPSYARFSLTPAGTVDGLEAFGLEFERLEVEAQ